MSLQIWLPLTSPSVINYGSSPITFLNDNRNPQENGKIGKYCHYTMASYPIRTDLFNINSQTHATLAMWIKVPSTQTANGYVGGLTVNSSPTFMFYWYNSNKTIRVYLNGTNTLAYSHGLEIAEVWHHWAVTYNGATLSLYLDGNLVKTGAATALIPVSERFILGARSNTAAGAVTAGRANYINDARYYDQCLSAAEIKELAQGLMAHYKMDNGGQMPNLLYNSNKFTSSNWALIRSTIPEAGVLRLTPTSSAAYAKYITNLDYADYHTGYATVTYDARRIEGETYTSDYYLRVYIGYSLASRRTNTYSTSDCYSYTNAGPATGVLTTEWQTFSYTVNLATMASGSTAAKVNGSFLSTQFYRVAKYSPVEIRNVKLEINNTSSGYSLHPSEQGDITQLQDSSGYNHNATINGSVNYTSDTDGRYHYSLSVLNNITSITVNDLISSSENIFTFSMWLNTSEYINDTLYLRSATKNLSYSFRNQSSGNMTQFLVFDGEQCWGNDLTFTIPLNEWHMWTGTFDGTTISLYKDGILQGSSNNSIAYSSTLTTDTTLCGDSASQSARYNDIRLYATALTTEEIRVLYEVSMKHDNLKRIHVFGLEENKNKIKILQCGILQCDEFIEENEVLALNANLSISSDGLIEK